MPATRVCGGGTVVDVNQNSIGYVVFGAALVMVAVIVSAIPGLIVVCDVEYVMLALTGAGVGAGVGA